MPPPPKRRVATSSANNDKKKQASVSKATSGVVTSEGAKRSATNAKAVGKPKPSSRCAEEQRSATMRSVNTALQTLAGIFNSHGKATTSGATEKNNSTLDRIKAAKITALKALRELRELSPGNFDVERAASSVITRLMAIGEYDLAVDILRDMQTALISSYTPPSETSFSLNSHCDLLSLPLPSTTSITDPTKLSIVATYFLHSLDILLHMHPPPEISSLSHTLYNKPTLLTWAPHLQLFLDSQGHLDAVLTRSYTLLTKHVKTQRPPLEVYVIRMHALRLLLHTSPGTIDPSTMWDQALKSTAAFVRSADVSEDQATQAVMRAFNELADSNCGERWRRGQSWILFCEQWVMFAKRAGDVAMLDSIELLLRSILSPSPGNHNSIRTENRNRETASDASSAAYVRTCAVFAQTTVVLETFIKHRDSEESLRYDVIQRIRASTALLRKASWHEVDPMVSREVEETMVQKVKRAADRLRRGAINLLEKSVGDIPTEIKASLCTLLSAMLDSTFHAGQKDAKEGRAEITSSLEILFILARAVLNPNDSHTYVTAYNHLSSASTLVSTHFPTNANRIRCLSSAFHHLAGNLYQSGKYGGAIRFLRDSCAFGTKALEVKKLGDAEMMREMEEQEEAWRALETQLFRRWELLAVCYVKTGEKQLAFESYIECVKAFPYNSSTSPRQIESTVHNLTYLAACDLLLNPEKVSLKMYATNMNSAVIGQFLEWQLDCLQLHFVKEGVKEVIKILLLQTLECFQADEPVKRARILVKCLEFVYHVGSDSILAGGWHTEKMGLEIEKILDHKDPTQGGTPVRLALYCLASSRFWLALHAHREKDPEQTNLIASRADEGCRILRTLLTLSSKQTISPVKTSPVVANKKPQTNRRGGGSKKGTRNINTNVTPRPQTGLEIGSQTPRANDEVKNADLGFEDFDRLLSLLEMSSRLLGLLDLVLNKIHVLELMRRLCMVHVGPSTNYYVSATIDLAHEYTKLGKVQNASMVYGHVLDIVKTEKLPDDLKIKFFLRYAEVLALSEQFSQSTAMYGKATNLAGNMEENPLSSSQRIRKRIGLLERAATAAQTFAVIQHCKENITAALRGMQQALRLWNRAADSLGRLSSSRTTSESMSNPFDMSSMKDALPATDNLGDSNPKRLLNFRRMHDGLEWRIADGLLGTLLSLVDVYFVRGSPREACYFAQQAQDLAECLNSPAMLGRALSKKGEIELCRGRFAEVHEAIILARKIVQDLPGTSTIEIHRVHADYSLRIDKLEDAQGLYERAGFIVENFDKSISSFDILSINAWKSQELSPRSLSEHGTKEGVLPSIRAAVLHQHILLLREDPEESATLLEQLEMLSSSSQTKTEESALMAKMTFHKVHDGFRADLSLSSIADSVIAMPMGISGIKTITASPSAQGVVTVLDKAEHLFWADLGLVSRTGKAQRVRDAAVTLARIRALQNSLGQVGEKSSVIAATLLDTSIAITLRREILDVIPNKFPNFEFDDLQWPVFSDDGAPTRRRLRPAKFRSRGLSDTESDADDSIESEKALKRYWDSILAKYQVGNFTPSDFSHSRTISLLPGHWVVVTINVTEDKNTLFISRQRASKEPLVFSVPLTGRREDEGGGEDDTQFTFERALEELSDIVKLSNEGTREAITIQKDKPEAKAAWWKTRIELDGRMKELLENIEFCWLGAFKTILSPPLTLPPVLLEDLKQAFEKVFLEELRPQMQKQPLSVKLDDALIECFSNLSPTCREEELEDLVYFILDLLQFHGVPIAAAEVDISSVTMELQMVLEAHALKTRRAGVKEVEDNHLFLVLDRNVQTIPWESMPILRGRSVSRIPSVEFLADRLQYASSQNAFDSRVRTDRAAVDPRKTYYVLNPSGDLQGTEDRFKDWLARMRGVGWQGVVGKPPTEQQFSDALLKKDLVIYFGHGGAEHYIRSHRLRNLPRCAATMLWGCSSGALRSMGDFDPVGTPYDYMLAGCPALVANLWDVTDRDIDKFAQSVFEMMHLVSPSDVAQLRSQGSVSLAAAIAKSREVCKLKYLTGAAPVIYGIPFYL